MDKVQAGRRGEGGRNNFRVAEGEEWKPEAWFFTRSTHANYRFISWIFRFRLSPHLNFTFPDYLIHSKSLLNTPPTLFNRINARPLLIAVQSLVGFYKIYSIIVPLTSFSLVTAVAEEPSKCRSLNDWKPCSFHVLLPVHATMQGRG